MSKKFIFIILLTVFCLSGVAHAGRKMPEDFKPEDIRERISEYIPFAVQKTFQPIQYRSSAQVFVITGTIEKNYTLYNKEKDNNHFAKDEKRYLYDAFKKLGWRKVDARNYPGESFGEVDITYTVKNRGPLARADFKIGHFTNYERRRGGENRAAWFLKEVAEVVNLRIKEQFQLKEISDKGRKE